MNSSAQLQLPPAVRERVFDVLTESRSPQWIETDPELRITRSLGSSLLPETPCGTFLTDVLPCLVGAQDIAPITFPVVNLDASHIVDVHLFLATGGYEVLLVDASAQHAETRETQQQAHEIALLNRRLEKLTIALDQARTEAETASDAKSRFIAGMSHEFRTPLTSVMGFTELMRSGVASDGEGLSGIRESAEYLLTLVDNLLEHGSSGSGPVALNYERVSPGQFFDAVASQLQPLAVKQQLELNVIGSVQAAEEILIDPIRCRQILINLLTNALRHTREGSVELQWQLAEQCLEVDVVDTGSGIPESDLERIFRSFERGQDAAGRPGAGLGLAISRQLTHAMGGTLTVTSQVGKGSVFSLRLPLQAIDQQTNQQSNQAGNPQRKNSQVPGIECRTSVTILVVDDDPNIGALLRLALTDAGHNVTICRSQLEVVEQMDTGAEPDVALVDLDLYGSDGLAVVAELRRRAPDLCVFAMSAASSAETVERTRAAGCLEFIAKPFKLVELIDLIEQAATTVQATP